MPTILFKLTLKTSVQFEFATGKECQDFKIECLKKGINAKDHQGRDYFYPAKRINEVIIYNPDNK